MRASHTLMLGLVLLLILTGSVLADGGFERPREILGGGASDSAAGAVSLRATLGQPLAGVVSAEGVTLGQGFWHGFLDDGAVHRIYLPLLFKNGS